MTCIQHNEKVHLEFIQLCFDFLYNKCIFIEFLIFYY